MRRVEWGVLGLAALRGASAFLFIGEDREGPLVHTIVIGFFVISSGKEVTSTGTYIGVAPFRIFLSALRSAGSHHRIRKERVARGKSPTSRSR